MASARQHKLTIGRIAYDVCRENCPRRRAMKVIFLFPLAFAFFGTIFILINDDFGRVAKSVAVLLAGGSIALLFTPVHFLVPLAMQLTICIWLALYFQMNR
jgi:hypothetical protein